MAIMNEYKSISIKAKKIIVQVKSGHVSVSHVRDLLGVIESECAAIGVLLTLKSPTKPMLDFAYGSGYYQSQYGHFPKMQILTIAELLDGEKITFPNVLPSFS